MAQRVGLTVREIADVFAALPADPQPSDWDQLAAILIAEAESRTAALRAYLEEIGTDGRLCEVDDRLAGARTPRAGVPTS